MSATKINQRYLKKKHGIRFTEKPYTLPRLIDRAGEDSLITLSNRSRQQATIYQLSAYKTITHELIINVWHISNPSSTYGCWITPWWYTYNWSIRRIRLLFSQRIPDDSHHAN